jgi:membrane protein insertase Oxa1/YidC/SpoIIIJ
MDILMSLWNELLFRPLLNLLIILYDTIGWQNLGWSIVWLTLIVRLFLLPLSIKDEKSRRKTDQLKKELAKVQKSFANNPALLRQKQRETFKKYRFRRWPKLILLAVQGLVLVLLYQVFLGGIYVDKFADQIYSFILIPERINTVFLGIDIAKRSFFLSFLSAFILFGNIWAGHRKRKLQWKRSDLPFAILFPIATGFILWYLPAVKALFVLGSQIFSNLHRMVNAFRASVKEQAMYMNKKAEEKALEKEKLPTFTERF